MEQVGEVDERPLRREAVEEGADLLDEGEGLAALHLDGVAARRPVQVAEVLERDGKVGSRRDHEVASRAG